MLKKSFFSLIIRCNDFTAAGAPALPAGYKEIQLGKPSSPVKIPANEKGEQIPVTVYPD